MRMNVCFRYNGQDFMGLSHANVFLGPICSLGEEKHVLCYAMMSPALSMPIKQVQFRIPYASISPPSPLILLATHTAKFSAGIHEPY